jgi:hypothetical protein
MIFVKSYDCPLTWLRGHIFKMCRKVWVLTLSIIKSVNYDNLF